MTFVVLTPYCVNALWARSVMSYGHAIAIAARLAEPLPYGSADDFRLVSLHSFSTDVYLSIKQILSDRDYFAAKIE